MTKRQLHQKDQIISPLIEQGQSPYQILTNHPELDMSVRSMYTYIDKGLFTARNIDLKRQAISRYFSKIQNTMEFTLALEFTFSSQQNYNLSISISECISFASSIASFKTEIRSLPSLVTK